MTLAEKLAAAQLRIRQLEGEARQRVELANMEAQIRQLEGASAESIARREPEVDGRATPYRKAPKTRELPIYRGKTIKEAQVFFYQAELKWREDGDITWSTDAEKVTHCVSCFEGVARDVWKRKERSIGVNTTSWEDFVEFMKNSISDPGNRSLDAIEKHEKAHQREGQSVQSFVSYLESIEDDLGYADDQQQRNHLFGKLRPEIRMEINRQGNVPPNREQLIAQAVRIENHLRLFNKTTESEVEPKGYRKRRDDEVRKDNARARSQSPKREISRSSSVTTAPNSTPIIGSRASSFVTCFRCHKEGHYASACPLAVCHNCKKPGHKAYLCPEPKRSGNESAPQ
jgi:hypothetical protein